MELLTGVADALAADVADELPDGPVREQVRAAVAILRRVARTLPGYTAYVLTDIADLRATLAALGAGEPDPELSAASELDVLITEDLRLRQRLAELTESMSLAGERDRHLRAALARLTEREAALRQSPWER